LSSQATTDGVVRAPSSFTMTLASLPSMTETTLFVVPRSIPMILPMAYSSTPAGALRLAPASRFGGRNLNLRGSGYLRTTDGRQHNHVDPTVKDAAGTNFGSPS
jgi:hypothetical protein